MFRDKLVCGIGDSRMHRQLLAEAILNFDKALQLVKGMKLADRSDWDLQEGGVATGADCPSAQHSQRQEERTQF